MTLPTKTMEVRFREKFLVEDLPPFEGMWWWKLKLNETAPHPQDVLAFIQSELHLSQNRILEDLEYILDGAYGTSILCNDASDKNNIKNNIIKTLEDIIKLISKKDNQSTLTKGN